MRLGDKLWESDKDRGTGIYGQNRQTSLQRSTQNASDARSNDGVVNPYRATLQRRAGRIHNIK